MNGDPKTKLKELADRGTLPAAEYLTKRVGGTDHEPAYVAIVKLPDGRDAQGSGRSKTDAEQNAAGALIQNHRLG